MTGLQRGLVVAVLFALGAVVGSFLNVVIHRLPAGRSLWRGGSACPSCGGRIAWYDNVPVLAWCWLRGRCRRCTVTIPARYPAVEAVCGLLAAAVAWGAIVRAGGDLLEHPGVLGSLGLRLAVALTAAAAGWVGTETTRQGTARPAAWLVAAPSLAAVIWAVAAP